MKPVKAAHVVRGQQDNRLFGTTLRTIVEDTNELTTKPVVRLASHRHENLPRY